MSTIKKLYRQIWKNRPHLCQVCGYPISKPVSHVFSHVYSKGAHPSLKYEPKNIELWCSTLIREDGIGCHEAWHQKPNIFWKRAEINNWQKPNLKDVKR